MKHVIVCCFLSALYVQAATAQVNAALPPVYFLDSIRVAEADIKDLNPNDIAQVSVYKGLSAIELIGADGKNGIIYIETKKSTTSSYWYFFRNKSAEYFKAVPNQQADSSVVYIVNEKMLKAPYHTELSMINESNFISLKIVDQQALIENYGIRNKKYGVIVYYNKPAPTL